LVGAQQGTRHFGEEVHRDLFPLLNLAADKRTLAGPTNHNGPTDVCIHARRKN
jgi:hypothetical protein